MADPATPLRDVAAAAPDRGEDPVAVARRTLATERTGLDTLIAALDGELAAPVRATAARIAAARGRLVVSGMGKSGHVARKIAATFASTGTPALFVHPAEASHGDLGMVTPDDVVMALSWSGETRELASLIDYAKRWEIALIGMTAAPASSLGREADILLTLPHAPEACPHGLAPTTSAMMQLALGDALAIAVLEGRGFTAERFHSFHPGGRLGAGLNQVRKVMHTGPAMPLARDDAPMTEALLKMTEKGLGCVGIIDRRGRLAGIITDGDLRRHIGPDLLARPVTDVMTRHPKTVGPETLIGAALDLLNQAAITNLFIVDNGRPVGVVHMHDLLRAGVA